MIKEWMARVIAGSRLRREERDEEKVGYDTGVRALNPFSGQEVPIFLANYVLMDYGTGAIMAVPAHDQRDYEFAVKYNLPIRTVIAPASPDVRPEEGKAFESYEVLVNSGPFTGLSSEEAMEKMAAQAREKGFGQASVTYRLRDWGISRQRYWGTPIPIIYCHKCGVQPIPYEQLPVKIPYEAQFTGEEGSRWKKFRILSRPPVRSAAVRPGEKQTPWILSSILPGTSSAIALRMKTKFRSFQRRRSTGCQWTSISAGWSTPSCT